MAKKTVVMSVGGSLISPDGVDVKFLRGFRNVLLNFVKAGNRAIIITGGGDTSRSYQRAARAITPGVPMVDLDWVGIEATQLNAELVRAIFGKLAYERIMLDPTKVLKTAKPILVGGGFKPGSSSDVDAVLAAITYRATTVINLSNITYVYDKDPSKFKDAKPLREMNWKAFRKLVGNVWRPGAHLPFDPVASRLAHQAKMELVVMNGGNLPNLRNVLGSKPFIGTTVR